jgi:hypothetical protein
VRALYERDGQIDYVVLVDYLARQEVLEEVGGSPFVTALIDSTPTAINVVLYARIVRRDSVRRCLAAIGGRILADAHRETSDDVRLLYDQAVRVLEAHYPRPAIEDAPATWADLDASIGPIEWAWPGWMARGFVTMLASEPGEGKSMLGLHLCAVFLGTHACWPDGQPYAGEPGSILWCEAEAAQSLNLQRAKAWGLPTERMLFPFADPLRDLSLDDVAHRSALASGAKRGDVRFVVIDSLSGARQGDENSSEMLSTVHWLAELARDTGKPILLIHHLRKRSVLDGDDRVSLERLRGFSGIVQPTRIVMALDAPDRQDPQIKRLSVVKSNLARFPDPLGLRIAEEGIAFCDAPRPPERQSRLEEAKQALCTLLEDGPLPFAELEAELRSMGIAMSTARRAKRALRIVSRQGGGGWLWALPTHEQDSDA